MKPIFVMMIGLPASGKSTYIKKEFKNFIVHSSDSIREELFNDVEDQSNNELVFQTLHNRIKEDLIAGENVVMDATNLSYKRRMNFLSFINDVFCEKACYLIMTPYEQCLKQNKMRNRFVPEDVIRKMYLNIDVPFYSEGWDFINIVWNNEVEVHESDLFTKMLDFDQENSNHSSSLGVHSMKTYEAVIEQLSIKKSSAIGDNNIAIAGYYHDIGKLKTKSFYNHKGELDTNAHYYNHEKVSAYDFLLYAKDYYEGDLGVREDIIDICQLIRWHMLYYNSDVLNNPKTNRKFINLFGKEFMQRLMILHVADKKSH